MTLTVDVCAATYRRLDLLRQLLDTLARQKLADGIALRIVIVDNDPDASARGVVETFSRSVPLPVVYECEPKRGISSARNRCFALCKSDWVCFVDDDETVAEDWLQRLIDAARAWKADVVFGPVLPRLPLDAPKWVVRGNYFVRQRFPTGTTMKVGATNNVLISRKLLDRTGQGFDPAYNLTGNGDTEFFYRLGSFGAQMIFCNEAIATETVLPGRISLGWLLRRSFRSGQGYARIFVPRMPPWQRVLWFIQHFAYVIIAAIGTVVLLPAGIHWSIKSLLKLATNCGQLSAPFGIWLEEYKLS
jgi:succinoglycan biosynthesis protein ExoM